MSFDEKVIALKNSYKTETLGDIKEGIFIKEQLYKFSEQRMFEERLTALIPEVFTAMPDEIAKMKYPSEQRPKYLFMDESSAINFGFSQLPVPATKEQSAECRDSMENVCKKAFPANVFFEKGEFEVSGTTLAWFDYKSHTVDGPLYNVMYCMPFGNGILHGIFNCPYTIMDSWKPVILQVMQTIEFIA